MFTKADLRSYKTVSNYDFLAPSFPPAPILRSSKDISGN